MEEMKHPEDEFKAYIDSLFVENETKRQLVLPTTELTEEEIKRFAVMALDEMEEVREAFLDFQDVILNLSVYSYLYPHLEGLADIAQNLTDLIEGSFKEDKLTTTGKKDLKKVDQVRLSILSAMKQKYESQ